jgi:hypothetical protein
METVRGAAPTRIVAAAGKSQHNRYRPSSTSKVAMLVASICPKNLPHFYPYQKEFTAYGPCYQSWEVRSSFPHQTLQKPEDANTNATLQLSKAKDR